MTYRVTSDPARVVVAGSSHGALCASFVAFRHPELYGNVLSQSGSYWWGPAVEGSEPTEGDADWQRLVRQYESAEKLPIRFYLEMGLDEAALSDRPKESDPLLANRHMRDALVAKGYDVHYSEYSGGHDYLCWRGSFADGLVALLGT